MIRLLIIVFALIVALGAGVGGLIHFGILPDFTGMIVPAKQAGESAKGAPDEPAQPTRVDPVFMTMDPLVVPVIRDGELKRNIYITFRLSIVPGQEEKARFHMSQLNDVYLRALYDIVPRQLERRTTLDLRRLKDRLMTLTGRVVGAGVVQDVLIQSVFER